MVDSLHIVGHIVSTHPYLQWVSPMQELPYEEEVHGHVTYSVINFHGIHCFITQYLRLCFLTCLHILIDSIFSLVMFSKHSGNTTCLHLNVTVMYL